MASAGRGLRILRIPKEITKPRRRIDGQTPPLFRTETPAFKGHRYRWGHRYIGAPTLAAAFNLHVHEDALV